MTEDLNIGDRIEERVEEILDVYQIGFLIKQHRGTGNWVEFWQDLRFSLISGISEIWDMELDRIDREKFALENSKK